MSNALSKGERRGLWILVSSLPSSLYLLKVFVCKINGQSWEDDDRQHKDDIELISEMLQN